MRKARTGHRRNERARLRRDRRGGDLAGDSIRTPVRAGGRAYRRIAASPQRVRRRLVPDPRRAARGRDAPVPHGAAPAPLPGAHQRYARSRSRSLRPASSEGDSLWIGFQDGLWLVGEVGARIESTTESSGGDCQEAISGCVRKNYLGTSESVKTLRTRDACGTAGGTPALRTRLRASRLTLAYRLSPIVCLIPASCRTRGRAGRRPASPCRTRRTSRSAGSRCAGSRRGRFREDSRSGGSSASCRPC